MRNIGRADRNLKEMHRATRSLTYLEQRDKLIVLVGALAGYVEPKDWDSCLNTTYSYIASCEVRLRTFQGSITNDWYCFDDNNPKECTGHGMSEQEAKDDFWKQWKEQREGSEP